MNMLTVRKHRIWLRLVALVIVTTFQYSTTFSYAIPILRESSRDTLAVRDLETYLKKAEHSIEDWKVIAIGILKELEKKNLEPDEIETGFREKFGSMLKGYGIFESIKFDITITRHIVKRIISDRIVLTINDDDLWLRYEKGKFIPEREKDEEILKENSPEKIIQRIVAYTDDFIGNEVFGEYLLFLLDLSIQISGREKEKEKIFTFLYEATDTPYTQIIHSLLEVNYRKITHKAVNQYIQLNLPKILAEAGTSAERKEVLQRFNLVEGYNIQAKVVPIKWLLSNTGQLAHIGLGQVYRRPVIYIDEEYKDNQDVLDQELYEISKWEGKREALGREPHEMRQWIRDNYEEALTLAEQWHREAPSVDYLIAQYRQETGHVPLTNILDMYPEEEDVNLAAGTEAEERDIPIHEDLPDEYFVSLGQLGGMMKICKPWPEDKKASYSIDYEKMISEPKYLNSILNKFYEETKAEEDRVAPSISQQGNNGPIELISNAIDAHLRTLGIEGIGQFGKGFYQVLKELRTEKDRIIVRTVQNHEGIGIVFRLINGTVHVAFSRFRDESKEHGTEVEVIKAEFSTEEQFNFGENIRKKFKRSKKVPVHMDGELINDLRDYRYLNGEKLQYQCDNPVEVVMHKRGYKVVDVGTGMDTKAVFEYFIPRKQTTQKPGKDTPKMFYKVGKGGVVTPAELGLQLSGVEVETVELSRGINMAEEFAIEFPPQTPLPDSRNEIGSSDEAIEALRYTISRLAEELQEYLENWRDNIKLINSLAHIISIYESKRENTSLFDTFRKTIREELKRIKKEENVVFLPAEESYLYLELPTHMQDKQIVYLNPNLFLFRPQEVGLTKIDVESPQGVEVFVADFKETTAKPPVFIKQGSNYIFNRIFYERYKSFPLLLNWVMNFYVGYGKKKPVQALFPVLLIEELRRQREAEIEEEARIAIEKEFGVEHKEPETAITPQLPVEPESVPPSSLTVSQVMDVPVETIQYTPITGDNFKEELQFKEARWRHILKHYDITEIPPGLDSLAQYAYITGRLTKFMEFMNRRKVVESKLSEFEFSIASENYSWFKDEDLMLSETEFGNIRTIIHFNEKELVVAFEKGRSTIAIMDLNTKTLIPVVQGLDTRYFGMDIDRQRVIVDNNEIIYWDQDKDYKITLYRYDRKREELKILYDLSKDGLSYGHIDRLEKIEGNLFVSFYDSKTGLDSVYKYDFGENTLTLIAEDIPRDHRFDKTGKKIIYIKKEDNKGKVFIYDVESESAVCIKPIHIPEYILQWARINVLDNNFFWLSGVLEGNEEGSLIFYDINNNKIINFPVESGYYFRDTILYNGKLYILINQGGSTPVSILYIYDLKSETVRRFPYYWKLNDELYIADKLGYEHVQITSGSFEFRVNEGGIQIISTAGLSGIDEFGNELRTGRMELQYIIPIKDEAGILIDDSGIVPDEKSAIGIKVQQTGDGTSVHTPFPFSIYNWNSRKGLDSVYMTPYTWWGRPGNVIYHTFSAEALEKKGDLSGETIQSLDLQDYELDLSKLNPTHPLKRRFVRNLLFSDLGEDGEGFNINKYLPLLFIFNEEQIAFILNSRYRDIILETASGFNLGQFIQHGEFFERLRGLHISGESFTRYVLHWFSLYKRNPTAALEFAENLNEECKIKSERYPKGRYLPKYYYLEDDALLEEEDEKIDYFLNIFKGDVDLELKPQKLPSTEGEVVSSVTGKCSLATLIQAKRENETTIGREELTGILIYISFIYHRIYRYFLRKPAMSWPEYREYKRMQYIERATAQFEEEGYNLSSLQQEITSTRKGQATEPDIWTRELVQNARDEIVKSKLPIEERKIEIETYTQEIDGVPESVEMVRDPVGTTFHRLVNYFFIPDTTTKTEVDAGFFGQGLFSLFLGADRVEVKTSPGDGIANYMKLQFIKDEETGAIKDIVIEELSRKHEPGFKGTEVRRITVIKEGEESQKWNTALIRRAFQRYTGMVAPASEGEVDILFNGKPINQKKDLLGEIGFTVKVKENGKYIEKPARVRLFWAGDGISRVTAKGLYMNDKLSNYTTFFGPILNKQLAKRGLVIDIDGIPLLGSRNELDGDYIPIVRQAVTAAGMRAAHDLHFNRGIRIEGLSEDFLSAPDYDDRLESIVKRDVRSIREEIEQGKPLSREIIDRWLLGIDYKPYLENPGAFIQLVTFASEKGLQHLRRVVQKREEPEAIEVPELLQEEVQDARRLVEVKPSEEFRYFTEEEILRDSQKFLFYILMYKTLSFLPFGHNIRIGLHTGYSNHYGEGFDFISLNVRYDLLPLLDGTIEKEGKEIYYQRIYDFLYSFLEHSFLHEYAHYFDRGKWTHQSSDIVDENFFCNMREAGFNLVREVYDPLQILNELKEVKAQLDQTPVKQDEELKFRRSILEEYRELVRRKGKIGVTDTHFDREEFSDYFGKVKQRVANRQIKRIIEDPEGKDYRFLDLKKYIEGWNGEGMSLEGRRGKLDVSEKAKQVIVNALRKLMEGYGGLKDYDIVILRGVNFSGHYGNNPLWGLRLYIPAEILEIADANSDIAPDLIEDFTEHEYLESRGLDHDSVVAMLEEKRGEGFNKSMQKLFREYVINRLLVEIGVREGTEKFRKELERILTMVQEGEEMTLQSINPKALFFSIAGDRRHELSTKVARLINLLLETNYQGRSGIVVALVLSKLLKFKDKIEKIKLKVKQKLREKTIETDTFFYKLKRKQKEIVGKFVKTIKIDEIPQKARKTILALDMDIGDMQKYATCLLAELSRQSERGALGNIYFIRGSGKELQGKIKDKINYLIDSKDIKSEEEADIVLVARQSNIQQGVYGDIETREHIYITEIDDARITDTEGLRIGEANYIPILEILTFALGIVYEGDYDNISKLYMSITGTELKEEEYADIVEQIKNNRLSISLILPPVEPVKIDRLREIYEAAKSLLISA